mgnify:FL=1
MKLNKVIRVSLILILMLFVLPFESNSQFLLTEASKPKKLINKDKSKSINRVVIPFIDDFSNYLDEPNNTLWVNSGAWVNTDYPIYPPTVGVVTFDALTDEGLLYPDANTTGFACDTLSSSYIRLDSAFVPSQTALNIQDSIYLSFFVQPSGGYGDLWAGIGSTPSKRDSLVLQFYSLNDDSWSTIWKIEGIKLDSIYARDSVYWIYVNIPITDIKYFNNSFRFRFLNFASLDDNSSYALVGNCDQWNVDYVYLNKDRTFDEQTIRDIAFVTPAYSLLKQYQTMPARQFRASDMGENLDINIVNLSNIPLNSIYKYEVFNSLNESVETYDGGFENIYPYIQTKEFQSSPNHAKPPINFTYSFDQTSWTWFDIIHTVKEGVGQDSRTSNDTIRFKQRFENYFAYDDATAENGFWIKPVRNSNLAVSFHLNAADTITAVDIYFNSTYEDANQKPFFLCIWNSLGQRPNDTIYRSNTYLTPTTEGLNQFARYILEHPVVLDTGEFFVSLETKNADYLNIGFDRNTDASLKIFGNWTNVWQQNTILKGSLMLRPYFGYEAAIGLRQVEDNNLNLSIYPNPTSSVFNINLSESNNTINNSDYEIRILNILGREVYRGKFKTQINVSNLPNGVYILSVINKVTHKAKQEKLIIQK